MTEHEWSKCSPPCTLNTGWPTCPWHVRVNYLKVLFHFIFFKQGSNTRARLSNSIFLKFNLSITMNYLVFMLSCTYLIFKIQISKLNQIKKYLKKKRPGNSHMSVFNEFIVTMAVASFEMFLTWFLTPNFIQTSNGKQVQRNLNQLQIKLK